MFERFGPDARRALFLSKFHAAALQEKHIEPEHLLSGLLRANDAAVLHIFDALGANLQSLGEQCHIAISLPQLYGDGPGLSRRARMIVRSANGVADEMGLTSVEPLCLLLAIMRETQNGAAKLLERYGVNYEAVIRVVRNST